MSTLITLAVLALVFYGLYRVIRRAQAERAHQQAMTPAEREAYRANAKAELGAIQAQRAATRGTKTVTKSRKKTSHLFHGIVTIFMPGGILWAPVWAFQTMAHRFGRREKTVSRTR